LSTLFPKICNRGGKSSPHAGGRWGGKDGEERLQKVAFEIIIIINEKGPSVKSIDSLVVYQFENPRMEKSRRGRSASFRSELRGGNSLFLLSIRT
jgi:hypothetical protein